MAAEWGREALAEAGGERSLLPPRVPPWPLPRGEARSASLGCEAWGRLRRRAARVGRGLRREEQEELAACPAWASAGSIGAATPLGHGPPAVPAHPRWYVRPPSSRSTGAQPSRPPPSPLLAASPAHHTRPRRSAREYAAPWPAGAGTAHSNPRVPPT